MRINSDETEREMAIEASVVVIHRTLYSKTENVEMNQTNFLRPYQVVAQPSTVQDQTPRARLLHCEATQGLQ